jgi:tetratricopeptide (TPR) repeat protein
VLLAVAVAVLLAYQPAWHGGLLWDDDAHLTRTGLRDWSGLWRIWTDLSATPQFYPVVHTAFWAMYHAWGTETLGYHLVTIAFHAASAGLLVVFLRRHEIPGALLAATVFALHPVHVESVAWISELKNTLSGVFYLLAALAYSRFDDRRDRVSYALALTAFVAALFSKTVTASLPAALLVFFWWRRGTLRWREDVLPTLPFFAVGIGAGLLTVWLEQAQVGARGEEFDLTVVERILIAGRAVWFYAAKIVWPVGLTFTYPRWIIDATAGWQYAFPVAAVGVFAIFWAIRRRSRAPLAAALFFVGTLVPALGFLNVYPFRYSFVADHFQYLASLGLIVPLSAWLAREATYRLGQRGVAMLLVVIGSTLAVLTWRQSAQYSDAETLYRAILARNPSSFMAHNNLGERLLQGSDADLAAAVHHLEAAANLNPRAAETQTNLGVAEYRRGRLDQSERLHRAAIALNPRLAEAHYNLGNTLAAQGRHDEAVKAFEVSLGVHPDNAQALHNRSLSLIALGRVDEAIALLDRALVLDPESERIRRARGDAYLRLRRYPEAVEEYRAVLGSTSSPEVHNNLGLALQHAGRLDEAIASFRTALSLAPESGQIWLNTARAFAAGERVEDALIAYQGALQFADRPTGAAIHHEVGRLLARAGRREEAVMHLQQAIAIDPQLAGAREDLARLRGGLQ